MPIWAIIAIIVIAYVAAAWFARRQRSVRLNHLAPDDDGLAGESWEMAAAQPDTGAGAAGHGGPHALPHYERERFLFAWRAEQARSVEDPKGAILDTDRLVAELMRACGYPTANLEQAAVEPPPEHPDVVENYRVGRQIVNRFRRGEADTEDLHRAMVCYRAIFDDLLEIYETKRARRKEVTGL
jgi:hypothetical protein